MSENKKSNTKEWAESYLRINKNSAILNMRTSFQKKAFFDYVKDHKAMILDVGCGSGGFIKLLKESGYKNVYGVEPSEELLKQHDNPDIKQGFATDLPFENKSFDCVYFFNVLHHLKNLEEYGQAVREVNRCLRSGGFVIMVEPCNEFIYTATRFISKLLAPVSEMFANMYRMIAEEKEDMTYFFRHSKLIRENLLNLNYRVLRDQKLFHQWTLVLQKSEENTQG